MRFPITVSVLVSALIATTPPVSAVDRNPTGVNVYSQGSTSVYITFGNIANQRPADSEWCGEIESASPDIGMRCTSDSLFGRLPERLNQERPDGAVGLTDIMSIPASVTRRAYQAAERGESSEFFYVRRFVSLVGGPDEYVFVTCRMAGVGARTPISLTNVRLVADTAYPVLVVRTGEAVAPIRAELSYTGTGWLRGRWEVVLPTDVLPDEIDLLSEAALPVEDRPLRRRYQEVGRFREFLPPSGSHTIEGPDPRRLPTDVEGLYQILFRVEPVADKESESNRVAAGAGPGIVAAGGVAGFVMPTYRYVVGHSRGDLALADAFGPLTGIDPADRALVRRDRPVAFSWSGCPGASSYLVEVEDARGERLFASIVPAGRWSYTPPPWLRDHGGASLSWRVSGIDSGGDPVGRSSWIRFTVAGN